MFGYEPRKPEHEPGSWGEIFAMVRVVFGELAKPILAIVGTLALLLTTIFLLFSNPPLAVLPVAVIIAGGWWLVRRDQQAIRDAEDNLPPHR